MPAVPASDITYEIQQSQDSVNWTPIARRVGLAAWDNLGGNSIVLENGVQDGMAEVQVGGAPIVSGEAPVQLRLQVSIPTIVD